MSQQKSNEDGGPDIAKLEAEFNSNKDQVVQMLIDNVMEVDCSIPRVVRGKFGDEEWTESDLKI